MTYPLINKYGILGISYCGSTLLSSILAQSPSVFSVGEAHRLVDLDDNKCTIHGKNCEFWTEKFLKETSNGNYYKKIVEQAYKIYKTNCIIFSDKNSQFYLQAINAGAEITKFILLFRKPEAFCTSYLKKPNTKNISLKQTLKLYKDGYEKNLELAKGYNIPIIKVFYDDLVNGGIQYIQKLCRSLYIPCTPNMLDYYKLNNKLHNLGGNAMVYLNFGNEEKFQEIYDKAQRTDLAWYKENRKKIIPDNRWETYLTEEQKNVILNSNSQNVFNIMMENRL